MISKLSAIALSTSVLLFLGLNAASAQITGAAAQPAPPTAPIAPAAPPFQKPAGAPPILTAPNHGVRIAITNLNWMHENINSAARLDFDFHVQNEDGSPVAFESRRGAIIVSGWTDNFDCDAVHAGNANWDENSQRWHVGVPGLDPRNQTAHLRFDVRAPSTKDSQTTSLDSDFRVNDITLPTKPDSPHSAAGTFTSNWGTVFTLKDVVLANNPQYGGQGQERYDFTVDHSKVPDDTVQLSIEKAFDNGVQIDGIYSMASNDLNDQGVTSAFSSPVASSAHPTATVEFTAQESAYSPIMSITWTPYTADIPLAGIQISTKQYSASDTSKASFNNVQYQLAKIASDQPFNETYQISTKSAIPSKTCLITRAAWTYPSSPMQFGQDLNFTLQPTLWHLDNTPLDAGEYDAVILKNGNNSNFPLTITTSVVSHAQQTVSFSKIPVPAPGQTLILDLPPDHPSLVPLRLRSITWSKPNSPGPARRYMVGPDDYALQLEFEYTTSDSSIVKLKVISGQDENGSAVDHLLRLFNASNGDQVLQTAVERVAIPPNDAKAIGLNLIITRDTPSEPPTNISISSDGKWSVLTPTQ